MGGYKATTGRGRIPCLMERSYALGSCSNMLARGFKC